MISLPLMMIAAIMGFIALIGAIAGFGHRPRGAHRA